MNRNSFSGYRAFSPTLVVVQKWSVDGLSGTVNVNSTYTDRYRTPRARPRSQSRRGTTQRGSFVVMYSGRRMDEVFRGPVSPV